MGWRDGTTIPAHYRDIPAPPFGVNEFLDRMSHVLCEYGGHIPTYQPEVAEQACEFHRRMAQAHIAYAKGEPVRKSGLPVGSLIVINGKLARREPFIDGDPEVGRWVYVATLGGGPVDHDDLHKATWTQDLGDLR